jgi:hypothetical protein
MAPTIMKALYLELTTQSRINYSLFHLYSQTSTQWVENKNPWHKYYKMIVLCNLLVRMVIADDATDMFDVNNTLRSN